MSRAAPGTIWRERTAELARLAWPVVLARLGIMIMGLTDAIVVGRYSAIELGYHALAWAPTAVVLTTAIGLLTGVQVLAARYLGEGRIALTGGVLRRGLAFAALTGTAAMLALGLGGPPLLQVIGLEPHLAAGAGRALAVFSLSLPFYLMAVACMNYLEAMLKPIPGMTMMWVANLVNLLLNLWLVPGTSGLPVSGAIASAFATFGARLVFLLGLLVYLATWREARAHGLFRRPGDGRTAAREQRRIGYATAGSLFLEASAFSGMSILAGWLSSLAIAAWAIVINVASIIFMAPLGLAAATAVLVGRATGTDRADDVRRCGLIGLGLTAAVTGTVALLVFPGAPLVTSAYTTEAELARIVIPAMALACLFYVADGLQVVAAHALRASGDVWFPTISHLISYGCVMLPLGWFLSQRTDLGVKGLVWSVIIASLLAASMLLTRFMLRTRRAPLAAP